MKVWAPICRCQLIIALVFIFLPLAAAVADDSCPVAKDQLIVPGRCIGKVCISMTDRRVRSLLGTPAFSKTIRGNVLSTWRSNSDYLFLVFKNGRLIDIHVTSNRFRTCENVSTGSTFSAVKREFPRGSPDNYTVYATGKTRFDWVAKDRGITFTFAGDESGPMVRLAVHRAGFEKAVGYSDGDEAYWHPNEYLN